MKTVVEIKKTECICKNCGNDVQKHSFLSLSCPIITPTSNGVGFMVNSEFELKTSAPD